MEITHDPDVLIEERGIGWIRYVNKSTGRRWEAHGTCVRLGDCMVGANVNGTMIRDKQDLILRAAELDPIKSYDTPISPEFKGCCPFTFVELERI